MSERGEGTPLRVALVLDRVEGGPARAALTAALALDRRDFAHTIVTREAGALDRWAEESGFTVVRAPIHSTSTSK